MKIFEIDVIKWFKDFDFWPINLKDIVPQLLPNIVVSILTALVPTVVSLSVGFEKYDFNNQEIDMKIIR